MSVAKLDVVLPSSIKREVLSLGVVEVCAFPPSSTPPCRKTDLWAVSSSARVASSISLERAGVRSRGGVGVQSVKINEGLEWKDGVPGTTGEMGGTIVNDPGSDG